MSKNKKEAKIASAKGEGAAMTARRCEHCDEPIGQKDMLVIERISFEGTKSRAGRHFYNRTHYKA